MNFMYAESVELFQNAVTQLGGLSGTGHDSQRLMAWGLHAKLLAAWDEPQRVYHTRQHLDEGLARIYEWAPHVVTDDALPVLVLAWWFHDATYDPKEHNNEELSALLAEDALRLLGVPENFCLRIARLVMATDHREAAPENDYVADVLLDVDLSILGAEPERFAEYEAQVRAEYSSVSDEDYAVGRGKVLDQFRALAFSEPPALYRTDVGQTLLEQARLNLGPLTA
jgi:predicted metal-dependent HD superfamily phosphohydrolase